jgi:cysteinyl-tRNA synthetase
MAILSDDLNTPRALSYLHALATAFYKASDEKTRKDFAQQLWASGQFLGFFQQLPTQWFTQAPALSADVVAGPAGPSPSEDTITDLIAQRQQDRRQGNFKEADRIRDTLLSQGIVLEDTSQHTTWRRIRRPS